MKKPTLPEFLALTSIEIRIENWKNYIPPTIHDWSRLSHLGNYMQCAITAAIP